MDADRASPNPSSSHFGRYQITSELGRGGMSTVYRAYDPRFKREVAIKVLPHEMLHDPTFRERFEREAQTIAALEYSSVVPVYDFGEEDGQPFLVMRYMTGGSLEDRLKRGRLELPEAARIFSRLAPGLDRAHQRGVVHRDLKPGNILFDEFDDVFISDFGIVKLAEATHTLTGNVILGTPAYMSPEQGRGDKDIDHRSDVYALGCILFQMLSGRLPYEATTPFGMTIRHLTEPIPNLLEVRPDLPGEAQKMMEKAMAKDREQRYSTAGELARALTELASRKADVDITARSLPHVPAQKPQPAPPPPEKKVEEQPARPVPVVAQRATKPAPADATLPDLGEARTLIQPPSTAQLYEPSPFGQPAPKRRWGWIALIVAVIAILGIGLVAGGVTIFTTVVRNNQAKNTQKAELAAAAASQTSVSAQATSTMAAQQTSEAQAYQATQTAYALIPTATPNPGQLLAAAQFSWNPALVDNFRDNRNNWDLNTIANEIVVETKSISAGEYTIHTAATRAVSHRYVLDKSFSNFYLAVSVNIDVRSKKTFDPDAGLVFNYSDSGYYALSISPSGPCLLSEYDKGAGSTTPLLRSTTCPVTPGQTNRLEAISQGSQILVYVNKTHIGTVTDARFTQGKVGLFITLYDAGDEAVFSFSEFQVRQP